MNRKTSNLIVIIVVIAIGVIGYLSWPKNVEHPAASAPAAQNPVVQSGTTTLQVSVVTSKQNAPNAPSVSIEYPKFPALPADFNAAIAKAVNDRLADFKKESADNDAARRATADPKAVITADDYSFIATWEAAQADSRYVSLIMRFDSYTGGANENQEIQTFNYDVVANKELSLADLFPQAPDYLKQISVLARAQLTDSLNKASEGNIQMDMLTAGTEPAAENFSDFTFTDQTFTLYFPKYAVAPGSFGEQHVTLPRSAVK